MEMRQRSKSMFLDTVEHSKQNSSLISTKDEFEDPDGWGPQENMRIIQQILRQIPKSDTYPHEERLKKIKWKQIAMGKKQIENIKEHVSKLLTKTRSYRLLSEMLKDLEKSAFSALPLPRKPSSIFSLFLEDNKERIKKSLTKGTGRGGFARLAADAFKHLSDEDREKYQMKADNIKRDYNTVLKRMNVEKSVVKKKSTPVQRKIKNCPLALFWDHLKEKNIDYPLADAKKAYAELSKKKKLKYILQFLDVSRENKLNLEQYELAEKVLHKDEMDYIDEYEGRPKKLSGYAIFMKEYMKKNNKDGDVSNKTFFKKVADVWKNMSYVEKNIYENMSKELKDNYDSQYLDFIKGLEPNRQAFEITKMLQKKINKKRKSKIAAGNYSKLSESGDDFETSTANDKRRKIQKVENDEVLFEIDTDVNVEEVPATSAIFKSPLKKSKNKLNSTMVIDAELFSENDEKRKRKYSSDATNESMGDFKQFKNQLSGRETAKNVFTIKSPPSSIFTYFYKEIFKGGSKEEARKKYKELTPQELKIIKTKFKRVRKQFLKHVARKKPSNVDIRKMADNVHTSSHDEISDITEDMSSDSD